MESLETAEFRADDPLFRENEPSHSMYIIVKGSVSIRKYSIDGSFVEVGQVHSGEVLGELSFFDRSPRSATAIALTEVQATIVSFDSLDKIYSSTPAYLKTIIKSCAERLRRANDLIKRLQKNSSAAE